MKILCALIVFQGLGTDCMMGHLVALLLVVFVASVICHEVCCASKAQYTPVYIQF